MHIHILLVIWCSCPVAFVVYTWWCSGWQCTALLDQHLQPPAGLFACVETNWRSRLTARLQDWWLVGLCVTLRGLILSNFIIWCAIDYVIICPSEKHYGHQSIWFSILDVPRGWDIDPGLLFPEARRAVRARGAGRDFLTMRRESNINRVLTRTGSSLLSFNVVPDLQMTAEWPLKNFECLPTLERPWKGAYRWVILYSRELVV